MTNYDAYEQVNNERARGREQRRRHGADQRRDKAEVRHEAILSWVINLRYVAPLAIPPALGVIFYASEGEGYFAGFMCVAVAMIVSKLIAGFWGWVRGAFVEHAQMKTENFWFFVGGALIVLLGLGMQSMGLSLSGGILALTPWVWTVWSRSVMANTDYARMAKDDDHAPKQFRIVE